MQVSGPEGYKLAKLKSLARSVACIAVLGPTTGLKGRILLLRVLKTWGFNFSASAVPHSE